MNRSLRSRPDDPIGFLRMLPIAALLWVSIAGGFLRLLHRAPPTPEKILPIDAQIVQAPPAPRTTIKPAPRPEPKTEPAPTPTAKPVPKRAPAPRPTPKPARVPPKPTPVEKPAPQSAPTPTTKMGAHAIFAPMPVIPDDLRDEAVHAVALARFHIHADGTVRVELVKPTPFPRINQIIMNTLKKWRFFPALDHGTPIPSLQDVKIRVDVS